MTMIATGSHTASLDLSEHEHARHRQRLYNPAHDITWLQNRIEELENDIAKFDAILRVANDVFDPTQS